VLEYASDAKIQNMLYGTGQCTWYLIHSDKAYQTADISCVQSTQNLDINFSTGPLKCKFYVMGAVFNFKHPPQDSVFFSFRQKWCTL
jgi:hypothetical protein